MNGEQWNSVEQHFAQLQGASPEERRAALAEITDATVRDEVAALLEHAREGDTVASVIGAMAEQTEQNRMRDQRIGPYRIVRRIGQGGQGTVFEALRDDGSFQQRVAIKIVKWELDTDAARERFRQERQILAGLAHPHIARLLDGGETADGTPYLVMEYVEGLPLTEAAAGWDQRKKLGLLLQVADAVAYAHRNLVVHRDLKPANILVTADGTPMLLDFGIAKLVDAEGKHTLTAVQALTPEYASPEQVRGLPITTATDVYSLGVVAYQLLTGRKLYSLATGTLAEMDRVVCEEPAPDPKLGGDLDEVLLMALRKEPERRYGTVQELAADIGRYLAHEPVQAKGDSAWYRARMYGRRHWARLLAASIALAGVLGGAGVAVQQARVAERRFQEVRQLSNTFLFQFHDQIADIPGTLKAREFVMGTAVRYLDKLAADSGGDDALQAELARGYQRVATVRGAPGIANLGDREAAEAGYKKALQLWEGLAARNPKYGLDLTSCLVDVAHMHVGSLRYPEARAVIARAGETVAPYREQKTAVALAAVALYLEGRAEVENYSDPRVGAASMRGGVGYWEEWAKVAGEPGAAIPLRLGKAYTKLGNMELNAVHLPEAAAALETALTHNRKALQLEPGNTQLKTTQTSALINLHDLYGSHDAYSLEQPAMALRYGKEAMEWGGALSAADPADSAARIRYVVATLLYANDVSAATPGAGIAEAERGTAMAHEILKTGQIKGRNLQSILIRMRNTVRAYSRAGRHQEALAAARDVVERERQYVAGMAAKNQDHLFLIAALVLAADEARLAGVPAEARAMLAEAHAAYVPLAGAAEKYVTSGMMVARLFAGMARDRAAAGACAEARTWHEKEVAVWRGLASNGAYAADQLRRAEAATVACR